MGIARILIISLSISNIFGSPTLNGRIFNGHTAKPGQFPYIVSINRNDNGIEHLCGASILNNYWIVTAAHCLIYWSGGNYEILSGTNLLQSRGIIYNVSNVIVHPDYNPINHTNDITLIKINGKFAMNEFVQTIQIGDIGDNEFCTVIGWGKNEHMEDPNALQFTQLTTLSFNECNKLSEGGRFVYGLGYGQVCAIGINATGPCFGDSGGPLVANGKLVGIVSYAITPCAQGYPDVYTRVSDYKDWINEILQNF